MPPESESRMEYEKLRKELKDLLVKKRAVDKNLNATEEQIYRLEGAYLEDTQSGNLVKGYDNYMKASQTKRKIPPSDEERIFSSSSAVFLKVKEGEGSGRPGRPKTDDL